MGAGAGSGGKFDFDGLPAGASGAVPAAGISGGSGFDALNGNTGARTRGGAEALKASGMPPQTIIDNKDEST